MFFDIENQIIQFIWQLYSRAEKGVKRNMRANFIRRSQSFVPDS